MFNEIAVYSFWYMFQRLKMDFDFPDHEEFSNYIRDNWNYFNALELRHIASKAAGKSESGI